MSRQKLQRKVLSLLQKIIRNLKFNAWYINGTEVHSGDKLGIIYAGNSEKKNYVRSLAFDDYYDDIYLGKKWLHNIYAMANKNGQN